MRVLGQLILSGVCERFPNLKVISEENGTDWLPFFVGRLAKMVSKTSYPTPLSMKPIEYFRRNIGFTYINEPHVVENRELLGPDKLMFATDFPHRASIWPNSLKVVERDTAGLPAEVRQALIFDNAIKAFNLPAPALV
jgi:predicted TIM-barrel fold metal-dependent hydrolase